MPKWLIISFLTAVFGSFLVGTPCDAAKWDMNVSGGLFNPDNDSTVRATFDKNFFLQGSVGLLDESSGWEVRANLANYADVSHHPADAGINFRINIMPLTASLIYNIGTKSSVQPYIGGGLGAYFYTVQDDVFGVNEQGTKFGFHLVGGVKVFLQDDLYLNAEYTRHFIPRIYFNNAKNYDGTALTLGIGYSFYPSAPSPEPAGITQEDTVLRQIQDLMDEIAKMKTKHDEIEAVVDAFYEKNDINATKSLLSILDIGGKLVDRTIKMINPDTGDVIIEGIISAIDQKGEAVQVSVKNDSGWILQVLIYRNPVNVVIGGNTHNEFNLRNIDKTIVVSAMDNTTAFVQEYRRIQYLEGKLQKLDQKISDAQEQLRVLQKQRDSQMRTQQPQRVIIQETYIVPEGRPYNRYRPYRYYQERDYVVPIMVLSTTPPTLEEKKDFAEKKKAHIQETKNR